MKENEESIRSRTFSIRDLTPEQLKFRYTRAYLGNRYRIPKHFQDDIIQSAYLEFLRLNNKFYDYTHFSRIFTLTCKHRYKDGAILYKKIKKSYKHNHFIYGNKNKTAEAFESNYDANKILEILKERTHNKTGVTPKMKLKIFEKILDVDGRAIKGKGGVRTLAKELGISYNNFRISLMKIRKEIREFYE